MPDKRSWPALCVRACGITAALIEDMSTHEMLDPRDKEDAYRRRLRWGLGAFLAIALFFLWQEHRAHLLVALPWLLLLACPLMHLFMHRGHRSHHHEAEPTSGEKAAGEKKHEHEHGGHGCC